MKRRLLLALAMMAGLVCQAQAQAHAAQRELVIGVEDLEYYPLYAMRDGEYVGAMREIVDAFARAKGYKVTYRPLPIKRLYAELVGGGIDLKMPDNPNWGTDVKAGLKVAYSKPMVSYIDGVLVRPGSVAKPVEQFATLGTVAGFTPYAWLDRVKNGTVALKENPRMELLLRQTVVGHVEGAYVNVAVAHHVLNSILNMPGALVFNPMLPHSRDFYYLSSVRHADVIAEFDGWMKDNAQLVKDIKDRFGAEKGGN
ncbi:MAG: transporter substrate-binding domain-containing protein [Magnetospirillum gryphiswaldense]|nr:transporter substrate-binding domain-containing protein [Magnetospirillum gryphiswaldense]